MWPPTMTVVAANDVLTLTACMLHLRIQVCLFHGVFLRYLPACCLHVPDARSYPAAGLDAWLAKVYSSSIRPA